MHISETGDLLSISVVRKLPTGCLSVTHEGLKSALRTPDPSLAPPTLLFSQGCMLKPKVVFLGTELRSLQLMCHFCQKKRKEKNLHVKFVACLFCSNNG